MVLFLLTDGGHVKNTKSLVDRHRPREPFRLDRENIFFCLFLSVDAFPSCHIIIPRLFFFFFHLTRDFLIPYK